jgi:hypothetical protein
MSWSVASRFHRFGHRIGVPGRFMCLRDFIEFGAAIAGGVLDGLSVASTITAPRARGPDRSKTMTPLKEIEHFLGLKRLAVVGVSRQAKDFTRMLWAELADRGYDLVSLAFRTSNRLSMARCCSPPQTPTTR